VGSGLLGCEIALLPFGDGEKGVGSGFDLASHNTNIQAICIFAQAIRSAGTAAPLFG
jgi:hypothetical protein